MQKVKIRGDIEIWKPVNNFESYQISNLGRIKNRHNKILKFVKHPQGYVKIDLCKNGTKTKKYIHRLVAIAFIPNPNNYNEVNHINGIKDDNRIENLEWCTSSQNQKHSFTIGLQNGIKGEENSNAKVTENDVREMRILRQNGWKLRELAKKYNINEGNISAICRRTRWKHIK